MPVQVCLASLRSFYDMYCSIAHRPIDAMTSDLSTSPLAPEKCQAYLKLLQNLRSKSL
jgi:hypothetical protein